MAQQQTGTWKQIRAAGKTTIRPFKGIGLSK